MKILLIAAGLLLCACAPVKPYYEIGLSAPIESQTDYWMHPDRSWQCSPPWFDAEAGIEWKNNIRLGVYHFSTVPCGGFNDKPEIYYNTIRISKGGGGWR